MTGMHIQEILRVRASFVLLIIGYEMLQKNNLSEQQYKRANKKDCHIKE